MRYSGIIFLVLAILLAGSATWLHNLWRENEIITEELDTSRIDYYLSDFSLYVTDSEGKNQFNLSGEHFVHHRKTETSDIYKPIIIVNHKNDTLSVVANKAQRGRSGDIELQGEVTLKKPESDELMGFDLQTADIVYSPSRQLIETTKDVVIKTTDGHIIEATGISEDLTTETIRLESDVHAEYTPATAE